MPRKLALMLAMLGKSTSIPTTIYQSLCLALSAWRLMGWLKRYKDLKY